jgi:hypothetical protein
VYYTENGQKQSKDKKNLVNPQKEKVQTMTKNKTKMKKEFSKPTKGERDPLYNKLCKKYPVTRVGNKIDRYIHNLLTTKTG